jgi:hypothetical protein
MSISSFNHALQRAFRAPSTCTAPRSSSSCTTTQLLLLDRSTSNHISADEQKQCTYHHIASRHVTSAHQSMSRAQAFILSHPLTHSFARSHISSHDHTKLHITLPLTPSVALKRAHAILSNFSRVQTQTRDRGATTSHHQWRFAVMQSLCS